MPRKIEVVDYDPLWIEAFEKEAAVLNSVFGQRVVEMHHIGSTSVPTIICVLTAIRRLRMEN
ncbi:MAG TPA: GrpB family protein [Pyrinomonadaceae bacterium]|nr:GrpB family protein [Pyrinomonadaceae bacterium]